MQNTVPKIVCTNMSAKSAQIKLKFIYFKKIITIKKNKINKN